MSTVDTDVNVVGIVKACGYPNAVSVYSFELFDSVLEEVKFKNELCFN